MESNNRLRQILYALTQGLQNIRRSPLMSLIVISTKMTALATLGFLLLVISDFNALSAELATQLKIVVFLDDQQDLDKMAADIEKISGVAPPVTKISRDQALDTMTEDLEGLKELLQDNNPFPASVEVEVTDIQRMQEVAEQIRNTPGVAQEGAGVQFNQSLATQLKQVQDSVQLVGSLFAGILILATLAIVINTIQLAVHHRHREIEIMRLVGAPPWFIRLPFVLEGVIFGVVSALTSTGLLVFWRLVPYAQIRTWIVFLPLPTSLSPLIGIGALLLVTGILMGMMGSLISVHRYLKLEFDKT